MLIRDAMTPQVHPYPVLNRQKRTVGMLTLSDLALRGPQELARQLSHRVARDCTPRSADDSCPITGLLDRPATAKRRAISGA